MKKLYAVMLLSVWILVGSCGTMLLSQNKVMGVERGMTQQEVRELLGTPDGKSIYGGMEEWAYQRAVGTSMLNASNKTILVRFINGRVEGMETFDTPEPHSHPEHRH